MTGGSVVAPVWSRLMDFRLELVAVPVSDVDRAIAFYTEKAGFELDHDHRVSDDLRFVQLTPPGSPCSIAMGTGIVDTEPGSIAGLQLVVDDIDAAGPSSPGVGSRRATCRTQIPPDSAWAVGRRHGHTGPIHDGTP